MSKYRYLFTLVIVLSLLGSCNSDDPIPTSTLNTDSVITAWLDSASITATRDESGVYYYPVNLNPTGSTIGAAGQVLGIYYTLLDLDSAQIDSYQPIDGDSLLYKYASNAMFPLGVDQVIGFMRVGETYNFLLPPNQGYQDAPSITTTDATGVVLLQVSLVSVLTEAEVNTVELAQIDDYIRINDLNDTLSITIERIDTTFLGMQILSIDTTFNYEIDSVQYFNSGVRYKELSAGSGLVGQNGDTITIDYQITYLDGTAISSRSNFTYELGSGIPDVLIPGLEFGLTLMAPGAEGIIMIPSSQAYRESARVIPSFIIPELIDARIIPDYVDQVEPYRTLVFNVTRVQ